jgi:acyl carrier protein
MSRPVKARPMTLDAIIRELKRILVEEMDVNLQLEDVDEKVPLLDEGLALDSILLVEFIACIEKHLRVAFEDADLRVSAFENLTTLAELLATKLSR